MTEAQEVLIEAEKYIAQGRVSKAHVLISEYLDKQFGLERERP